MLMAFEGSLGAPFQHGLGVKDEREIRFLGGGGIMSYSAFVSAS